MELRWLTIPVASALYAAGLQADAMPVADSELAAAVAQPARRLKQTCDGYQIDFQRLLDHLIYYASELPPGPPRHEALTAATSTALLKLAGNRAREWSGA